MKKRREYFILIFPLLYVAMAIGIVGIVLANGMYPQGSETLYHVYRGDYVYRSIGIGNWFPLLSEEWYNGVELLRYKAPLPAYFMAFCQMLASGDAIDGYLIFVGLVFFLGAMGWLWIGWKKKRICLGAFLGVLWFFMPNNLLALFAEGNLDRSLCMVFLPLFFYCITEYLESRKMGFFLAEVFLFALLILCNPEYASIVALAVGVYLVIHFLTFGRRHGNRQVVYGLFFGFCLTGVWLLPAMTGGLDKVDTRENMVNYYQSALLSLNPVERYETGFSHLYFGLAAALVAFVGMFLAAKKQRVGFMTGTLLFLGTTNSAYYVMRLIPGSQSVWMLRMISIALCIILYSLFDWKKLKRYILCIMLVLLVADAVPSLSLLYGNQDGISAEARLENMQDATLIREGLLLTEQRMALMDMSTLGAEGAFLVSGWEDRRSATFGGDWESAATAQNIRNLNAALGGGYFNYVFDRCKELGNDTVLVRLSCLPDEEGIMDSLNLAAALSGYREICEQNGYKLYQLEGVSGNWGVKSRYEGIAIGTDSFQIAVQFPSIEEGRSANLNDYTYEELLNYETIYLGTFSYYNKERAEELIVRLSEAGVKIVISADGIPEDNKTHSQSFLGVRCEKISFHNGYPELIIHDELINPDLFPAGYTEWQTVYTDGLSKVEGYLIENELTIPFMGKVVNDNIQVMGLRIAQFCSITKDRTVTAALGDALGSSSELLPERKIVPLEVAYGKNSMVITSPEDAVNTTLSYHKIFKASREIREVNHFLVVESGTTEIKFFCAEMFYGLAVTLAGAVFLVAYVIMSTRKKNKAVTKNFLMKALVTGAENEVARTVMIELGERGFECVGYATGELDMTNDYAIEHLIGSGKWDVVIHCAEFAFAEENAQGEWLYTIVDMPGGESLRDACVSRNIPLVAGVPGQIAENMPATAKVLASCLMDRV